MCRADKGGVSGVCGLFILGQKADALVSCQEAIDTFIRAGASEHHPARDAALAGINLVTCG